VQVLQPFKKVYGESLRCTGITASFSVGGSGARPGAVCPQNGQPVMLATHACIMHSLSQKILFPCGCAMRCRDICLARFLVECFRAVRVMQVLRQVLPLPFLRVGSLLAAERGGYGGGSGGGGASVAGQQPLDERWHRMWFVLDADSFRTAPEPHRQSGAASLWDHVSTLDFQDDFQDKLLEPLSTSRRALSPSAAAPGFHALTRETVQLRASRCCSLQVGAHRLVCPWRAHNCQAQQAGVVLAAKYQCSYLNHLRSISGSLLDHRRRAGGGIQHPAVRHTVRQTCGGPGAAQKYLNHSIFM